jgi:acetyl esterase/lipase
MGSAGAPPAAGTRVEPVDADGVAAEWVVAAGVTGQRVVLCFHGGGYQTGSPASLRGLLALVSAAAQARVSATPQAAAWPSGRWWRCVTPATRCPARP